MLGLQSEIQNPERGGQAELKAHGLEMEGTITPSGESLPGHHCCVLGLANPALLAPSPSLWHMGSKATHTVAKTCNPPGKLVSTRFLPRKPGLGFPSWRMAKGDGGGATAPAPLHVQLARLRSEVWGGIALPQKGFQQPFPTLVLWVKCRKGGKCFPRGSCRLKLSLRCRDQNSPSPSAGMPDY